MLLIWILLILQECVLKNKKAVYDLMASHGDQENLVHFTLVMRDFDEVIENNIANGQYGVGKCKSVSTHS